MVTARRYQDVETHPAARRQGLAGMLVYQAGRYALAQLAASTLVIVAEPDQQAIRVYRSCRFEVTEDQVSFERAPGASPDIAANG
jgi:ribosomal protein S18 acetylase RimI-like enzyme